MVNRFYLFVKRLTTRNPAYVHFSTIAIQADDIAIQADDIAIQAREGHGPWAKNIISIL